MIINILSYFSTWNLMRWVRLVVALLLIGDAIFNQHLFPLVIGGFFLLQVFTNTGCCTNGACEIPSGNKANSGKKIDNN
jgi:hypothetical protein